MFSMGLGGDLDEDCVGRGVVDPTGSSSGNAKTIWLLHRGGGPGTGGFGGNLDEDCVGRGNLMGRLEEIKDPTADLMRPPVRT